MLLNYTPEGEEAQQWPVKLDKLMSSEAEAIEKVTGLTYEEFSLALVKGSITARRALLWVMLKRTSPTLRHGHIDPPINSIVLEFEPDEWRDIRAAVADDEDLTDEERASALSAIDEQLADAGDETPKVPASESESS